MMDSWFPISVHECLGVKKLDPEVDAWYEPVSQSLSTSECRTKKRTFLLFGIEVQTLDKGLRHGRPRASSEPPPFSSVL